MNAQTPSRPETADQATATPPAESAKRRVWRRVRPVLAVLVLSGAALGGNWWWQVGRFQQSTDNAYVQADIAVLSSRIDGEVAQILVEDNQAVTAGQALIRIDDRDWRARRDSAAADLAQAEAAIATVQAQLEQQRAQIAAADAQVAQAEAERVRAVANADRAGSLVRSGYTSREAGDQAVADRRKAEAAVSAAQANLAAARAALPVLEAQGRSAEARRDAARAGLDLAESNLAHAVIRAPFDGMVGNRAAQLGQHVGVGQSLIAVAPPPSRQYVVANFKETQVKRMRPGMPVTLSLDVGTELHGVVASLAPATGSQFSLLPPENATGNFTKVVQRVPVRIAIAPGQDTALLRPGLSVEAEVDTRADPHAPRGVLAAAAASLHLAR
ncbi:HlyD family secretion protein [Roseomonas sp. OT10]|uniref:HlyD family secretion protein n=1 Tax=Roseomonas cutis TaxID=2897332 RepID=UPI001E490BE3|nr:HlyD family secretion protein [Roseomonas sp. OT10]UFN49371.1 HlyD family secretion protein [Roseomonas sp. OT10]